MKKFVSRCHVLRNGAKLSNLKTFKWNARKTGEQFKLLDGVGMVDTIPDQTFTLDYVVPTTSPKLDWSDVRDDTILVLLKNGSRVTFSGVDCMEEGEITLDGEKESVMTLMFGYDDFVIE